ncbi:MAG TPA: FAD-dependent monooxygenase [Candidatus Limnocylindria bacterium]|nr:FAD-dependent monooxygenase [Candidatus Limnocylindria bacterium]
MDVIVVGAGAVGLTLAGRLAQHGATVLVFEAERERRRVGSKAICMQRETLEIWQRVGVGERVAQRGVQWRIGRTYYRGRQLFEVHLPDTDEHFPPFVNISQSEVEDLLEGRLRELDVPVHRGHRFTSLTQDTDGVTATFETDEGAVQHRSAYLVGADGAHSPVRHAIGMNFTGYTFDDRFLIADVRADLPMTNERHFHFDPPWNPGRQVLIHPQPDGVWRIDWQVPPDTDADAVRTSGELDRRIRQVVGESTPYELVWMTGYRFSQRVAGAFRHGRVFLAGDAAHVMSPFGARGLNSGISDVENLAWKLAAATNGAPDSLLDTYEAERRPAALANLAATEATMRFMAPHGPFRRAWRNLVLRMAPRSAWFRRRVNSGRLAEPASYEGAPSVTPGPDDGTSPRHGTVAPDARLPGGTRLREHLGRGFIVLLPRPVPAPDLRAEPLVIGPDTVYGSERAWMIRPDGYIAGSALLIQEGRDRPELSGTAP